MQAMTPHLRHIGSTAGTAGRARRRLVVQSPQTRHATRLWLGARSRETREHKSVCTLEIFAQRVEAKQMNNLLANIPPDGGDAEASLMPSGSASTFSSSSVKPTPSSSNSNAAASTTEPWAARNPMTTTAFQTTQQQTIRPLNNMQWMMMMQQQAMLPFHPGIGQSSLQAGGIRGAWSTSRIA